MKPCRAWLARAKKTLEHITATLGDDVVIVGGITNS